MWESIKHLYGDSSIWDDGKFKKENDHKEIAHEDVEHIPNTVIVEVCALPRVHFINVGWLPLDGLPISQCVPKGEYWLPLDGMANALDYNALVFHGRGRASRRMSIELSLAGALVRV
jgi:hypothetical protein